MTDKKSKKFFTSALQAITDHAVRPHKDYGSDYKALNFRAPKDSEAQFDFKLGEALTTDHLLETIQEYLDHSINAGHPLYFNQLWGGRDLPSVIGEYLAAVCNTSMATYEIAPMATLMEHEIVQKMGALAGFKNTDGIMCTGGSNGNQLAMMCALQQLPGDIKSNGLSGREKAPVCFVSDQAHYSFLKSAITLGLGQDHVITVESDDQARMKPDALEAAIQKAIAGGLEPFFIGATSGTTVRGAFDPLPELSTIARGHDLWLHVDGAYGGSVLMSPAHRHHLDGLALADSFVWDAHKMMGVPLIASVFLLNNKADNLMRDVFDTDSGDYIFHEHDLKSYDLGPKSLQCGRRNDAAKLWLAWKYHGDEGYARRIDHLFQMRDYVSGLVEAEDKLEMMFEPSYVNVCFRYIPAYKADLNQFNKTMRENLIREGQTMVNQAVIGGKRFIRLILANPDVTEKDLDRFIEIILGHGKKLEKDNYARHDGQASNAA